MIRVEISIGCDVDTDDEDAAVEAAIAAVTVMDRYCFIREPDLKIENVYPIE